MNPRLLFLADQFPFPILNGVTVKSANLLRGLAAHYRITLLAFADSPPAPRDMAAARELCEAVHLMPRSGRSALRSLARGEPPFTSRFRHPDAAALVDRITREQRFDVAHFDTIGSTVLLGATHGRVPVTVASPSDSYTLLLESRRDLYGDSAAGRLNEMLVRRYERRVYPRFDVVHFVSPVDSDYVSRLAPGARIATVPNGVPATRDTRALEEPRTLVFLGNMLEGHGVSILRFVRQVLPVIRRTEPDVRLLAVGADPPAELRAIADADPGIVVSGYVEDLDAWLARGAISLSLSPQIAGLQNKVLQSMALGKTVVGLPQNFRAFEGARDGEHFVSAPTLEAMAEPIVRLIRDDDARHRIGGAARALIASRYTWDRVIATYLATIS